MIDFSSTSPELSDLFPFPEHDHPVACPQDLLQFRRYEDARFSLVGEGKDESLDLRLGADVDPAGRFVQDQQLGSVASQRARMTFCWFPPLRFPTACQPGVAIFNSLMYSSAISYWAAGLR